MDNLINANSESDNSAIQATNSSNGAGIWSHSQVGASIVGQSVNGRGILGESNNAQGVWGVSHAQHHSGVTGVNDNQSVEAGPGVFGTSRGAGVWGKSETWIGVFGETVTPTPNGAAGIWGRGNEHGNGVVGESVNANGVRAVSTNHEAIHAETTSNVTAAIAAFQNNPNSTGAALYAKHIGNGPAAVFEGNVFISKNIISKGDIFLENADFAEDFDILDIKCEVGSVMVLSQEGALSVSTKAYDKKVAGVLSGAGNYKPGIILDRHETETVRMPLAMMGKVYCKVDANYAPIEIGDLLTTSDTEGHAMKATDSQQAFGTVIGKALKNFDKGTGIIPILVSLQ